MEQVKELTEVEKAKKLIEEAEQKEKLEIKKYIESYLEEKGYTFKIINELRGQTIINHLDLIKVI